MKKGVVRAKQKSRNNQPSSAKPNNVEVMIAKFLITKSADRREIVRNLINEHLTSIAEDLGFVKDKTENKKTNQDKTILKDRDF